MSKTFWTKRNRSSKKEGNRNRRWNSSLNNRRRNNTRQNSRNYSRSRHGKSGLRKKQHNTRIAMIIFLVTFWTAFLSQWKTFSNLRKRNATIPLLKLFLLSFLTHLLLPLMFQSPSFQLQPHRPLWKRPQLRLLNPILQQLKFQLLRLFEPALRRDLSNREWPVARNRLAGINRPLSVTVPR